MVRLVFLKFNVRRVGRYNLRSNGLLAQRGQGYGRAYGFVTGILLKVYLLVHLVDNFEVF
jgi:hypothetical protein